MSWVPSVRFQPLVHASALIRPSAILRNEAQIISSSPNIFADGKTAIGGGSRSGGSAGLEVGRNRIHRREWRRPGRAIAQASATIRACRPEFAGLSNMPAYFIERLRLHQQAIANLQTR